jgi:hypothetical protein
MFNNNFRVIAVISPKPDNSHVRSAIIMGICKAVADCSHMINHIELSALSVTFYVPYADNAHVLAETLSDIGCVSVHLSREYVEAQNEQNDF